MAERSREEVQEFVLERIGQWSADMIEESNTEEHETLTSTYSDIERGKMLYKHQAKWLERKLEDECRFLAEHSLNSNSSFILQVDSLSIYADAWAIYCRPGTYMIVQ
jgi:hypothetical protein